MSEPEPPSTGETENSAHALTPADTMPTTADLIGLHHRRARLVVVAYFLSCLVLVLIEFDDLRWGAYLPAMALGAGGVLTALGRPSRGLPVGNVMTATALASVMVGLGAWAVRGVIGNASLVLTGTAVLIGALLCFRDREGLAWVSATTSLAVMAAVTMALGFSPLPTMVQWAHVIPVLVVTTVFAILMRPMVEALVSLRVHAAQEIAEHAAEEAASAERLDQLRRVEGDAGDMLDRIAAGEELSEDDVEHCRLLQARLRDGIRAPGLDTPTLAEAFWRARARGVEVTVLDDRGGVEPIDQAVMSRVHRVIVDRLAWTVGGDEVTVRVPPAGRDAAVSVVIRALGSGAGHIERLDFTAEGALT